MSALVKIIETYRRETFFDEDGNILIVEFGEGATMESIKKFEVDNDIKLPEDLKELLLYSNGIGLFGIQIHALEEMEYFPRSCILTFHTWGNGDFDCLSIGGAYPRGTIIFMSHSEDKLAIVSNNLIEWFLGVIAEIKGTGTLLHPLDFDERGLEGMYKNVSYKID
jgi:hypothetical protein